MWEIPRVKWAQLPKRLVSTGAGSALNALTFFKNGSLLAVAGKEHCIKFYNVETGFNKCELSFGQTVGDKASLPGKVMGHTSRVLSLCAHPTAPQVLASCGMDQQVLLWDFRHSKVPVAQIFGPQLSSDAMDISRDGCRLLVCSHRSKHPLEIYDIRMLKENKDDEGHVATSAWVDFERNTPLVSYEWQGNEDLVESGGRRLGGTSCLPFACSWDEENKFIAAAGEQANMARVFEMPDPNMQCFAEPRLWVVGTIRGMTETFWSAAMSADGRNAAFGASDGAICIVDIRGKK
eukprot:gnl/TRDRNA2_/TRDRNA2_165528_c1_seq2.p1 gnl/TRDRNA2_/TRDRNA2_165528_c1~~gnl/TRDRNA2_/TRDRNA2_165528_c1_seq2.p1  ORF type:complete len:302 (+),score=47.67 gnl/TRDRNA2_/TRDRNA2_165528_c1_seq2:33-908(+)